jgi:hypothetical protein
MLQFLDIESWLVGSHNALIETWQSPQAMNHTAQNRAVGPQQLVWEFLQRAACQG